MISFRVAGAKIPSTEDIDANEQAVLRAIDFAASENAAILLTPEGSLSGYTDGFDREHTKAALERVTKAARERNLGLALGTCFEEDDGNCYNQIRFYGRDGRFLGFHSKTLRCGTHDMPPRGEINKYAASPLRTFEFEGVAIGGLICNDMWANPRCTPMPDTHMTVQLKRMGARVIFHAVASGMRPLDDEWATVIRNFHESNSRIRARTSELWVVATDAGSNGDLHASSPAGVLGPDGNWACKLPWAGEEMFAHTIDLEE